MNLKLIAILTCLLLFTVKGQNTLSKKLLVSGDTLKVDSLSLVSYSIALKNSKGALLDSSQYYHPLGANYIVIKNKNILGDSLSITYESYPFQLNELYAHKEWQSPKVDGTKNNNPFSIQITPQSNWFEGDGVKLDKRGSISRGVIFGSQQSLAVNSNFNLQLSGELAPNLKVLASMSDENIPIQPQGNTQQLQDFDRIFIQLYNKDFKLIGGDFDYQSNKSHFLRFRKRLKGISFYTKQPASKLIPEIKKGDFTIQTGGALTKGKFSRNEIQGIEGNQGPYQLNGNNNERFIMILSGTERIYIDGELLKRGQEYDYIIDYNTAQITFTSNRLITKDKRIRAEFQYSDQNYLRSVFHVQTGYEQKNWNVQFDFYNEQDHKNQLINQDLSDLQKEILANAGDNLTETFYSSIDSLGFDENRVMYRLTDSLGFDSVLVYSPFSNSNYIAIFSEVGNGNGDYVSAELTSNGRSYKWIAPQIINGTLVRFGNYAPVRILIPSEKKQVLSLNGNIKIKSTDIQYDFSFSNLDKNTFSSIDQEDNQGYAALVKVSNQFALKPEKKLIQWTTLEYNSKHFNPVERFRSVEFNRDWNINLPQLQLNKTFLRGNTGLSLIQKQQTLKYEIDLIQIEAYQGIKQELGHEFQNNWLTINNQWSYLYNKTDSINNHFLRNKDLFQYQDKAIKFGFRDDHEWKIERDLNTNNLATNSYQYYDWQVFAGTSDSLKNSFLLYYGQRFDRGNKLKELQASSYAQNMGLQFNAIKNRNHTVKTTINYRILNVKDSSLTNARNENTLLGRVEHQLRLLKRAITFQTFYEIGSGLERKREFRYIEVAPGAGNYIWNDYNNNQVKELNEFELDPYSGFANYIRTFILTNELNTVYTNEFNERIQINFGQIIKKKKGVKKFLSLISNQSNYQSKRSTLRESTLSRFNPFSDTKSDSFSIQKQELFRNTLSFNRNNPQFNFDYNFQNSQRSQVLSDGLERYQTQFHGSRLRWNFFKSLGIILEDEIGFKNNLSENTPNKNFQIQYFKVSPSLVLQPNTKIRVSLNTSYQEKSNHIDLGGEQSFISLLGIELKYNEINKGLLQFKLNYIYNKYLGEENSSVSFEMLESLQVGENYVIECNYQRSIGNNLQLTLNYTARLDQKGKLRQIGGVQLRAFF